MIEFRPVDEVIHGSWSDKIRGLPAVPDNYFAHTIADPPRGKMTEEQVYAYASEVIRTTKGWALILCSEEDLPLWSKALEDSGATRWPSCIWLKPGNKAPHRSGPAEPCEFIINAWCGAGASRWNGGGKVGCYEVPSETKRFSAEQKPLRLIKNLVLDFTMPGDLIADGYGGYGTLAVAARTCGRRFVLWEIRSDRASLARDRVQPVKEQLLMESLLHQANPRAFGKRKTRKGKNLRMF